MIQRIQTIWLLLATTCVFLTMQFSTYVGNSKDDLPMAFLNGKYNALFTIFTTAVGVATLISIFLFRNRRLQIKINVLAVFMQLGLISLYFFEIQKFIGKGAFALMGSLLHFIVIVSLLLSLKGILADNKIIKDSDRLR